MGIVDPDIYFVEGFRDEPCTPPPTCTWVHPADLKPAKINVFLCICIGLSIDKWGGPLLSVILATFHLCGAMVMAGSATHRLNSYPLLVAGKVIAAIGDGSLDNAQHRIFSTYFAPGKGFAFSIGERSLKVQKHRLVLLTRASHRRHLVNAHLPSMDFGCR